MIILNDLRRLQALKEGKPADAVRIARENYDKKSQHKRRKKFDCNAGICIIYPYDERNGYADTIQKFCYIKQKNSEILSKLRNSELVGVSGVDFEQCYTENTLPHIVMF